MSPGDQGAAALPGSGCLAGPPGGAAGEADRGGPARVPRRRAGIRPARPGVRRSCLRCRLSAARTQAGPVPGSLRAVAGRGETGPGGVRRHDDHRTWSPAASFPHARSPAAVTGRQPAASANATGGSGSGPAARSWCPGAHPRRRRPHPGRRPAGWATATCGRARRRCSAAAITCGGTSTGGPTRTSSPSPARTPGAAPSASTCGNCPGRCGWRCSTCFRAAAMSSGRRSSRPRSSGSSVTWPPPG